jgi:hypothetical protein
MKLSELIVYCLDLVQLSTLKYRATEAHVKPETRNPKLEPRNFAMSKLLNDQSSFVPRKFLLTRLRQ